MATKTVTFKTKKFIPVVPCTEVVLCLSNSDVTESGAPYIFATVLNTGRPLGNRGMDAEIMFFNPRAVDLFQYELSYDDTQLAEDEPLDCALIVDLFPHPCIFRTLLGLIP